MESIGNQYLFAKILYEKFSCEELFEECKRYIEGDYITKEDKQFVIGLIKYYHKNKNLTPKQKYCLCCYLTKDGGWFEYCCYCDYIEVDFENGIVKLFYKNDFFISDITWEENMKEIADVYLNDDEYTIVGNTIIMLKGDR